MPLSSVLSPTVTSPNKSNVALIFANVMFLFSPHIFEALAEAVDLKQAPTL